MSTPDPDGHDLTDIMLDMLIGRAALDDATDLAAAKEAMVRLADNVRNAGIDVKAKRRPDGSIDLQIDPTALVVQVMRMLVVLSEDLMEATGESIESLTARLRDELRDEGDDAQA